MTNYWISWYHKPAMGPFELHWPWWVTGARWMGHFHSHPTICAAVRAPSEDAAKEIIAASYERPCGQIEWRFCLYREFSWDPFTERFPCAGWMRWPSAQARSQALVGGAER